MIKFIAPAYVFLAVTLVLPVLANMRNSLFDVNNKTLLTGKAEFVGFRNYQTLFESGQLPHSIGVTLVFVIATVAVQYVLGFALAQWLSQRFPGSGWLRGMLVLSLMQAPIVTGVVFKWILDGRYGIFNDVLTRLGLIHGEVNWLIDTQTALPAIILINAWVGTPFMMTLLTAGLKSLPTDVYEAAKVDGASIWQRFRYITWPLMRPVSLTAIILCAVFTFKVFDLVYVTTAGGPADSTKIMTILMYDLSFRYFRFGEGAAAATVLILLPLALSAIYAFVTRGEGKS